MNGWTMTENDILERKVKEAVKDVLKNWGCYQFWPIKTSAMGATTVDCLACVPVKVTKEMVGTTLGVFVAIETKRTKVSEPTKKQELIFKQVIEAGGGAALIHAVNDLEIEDGLIKAIEERGALTWVTVGAKK
jgi:hypothetical protein